MTKNEKEKRNIIAHNRKARHDYFIEESFEAGIVLLGSEVKSVRACNVNIIDAYADQKNDDVYLLGSYIAEYKGSNNFNHPPRRPRKLLLRKREISKLFGKLKIKGYTLVPLSIYINEKNLIKVEMGLAKGKKQHDKRASEKERDWKIEKSRILKNN